jgi:hypothetical protein
LLEHVKDLCPERLELWVFQRNEGARRFYERHGFELVRLTDGAGNMEREPDALYEWRPSARAGANAFSRRDKYCHSGAWPLAHYHGGASRGGVPVRADARFSDSRSSSTL